MSLGQTGRSAEETKRIATDYLVLAEKQLVKKENVDPTKLISMRQVPKVAGEEAYVIGSLFERGKGVPRNLAIAAVLYRFSAQTCGKDAQSLKELAQKSMKRRKFRPYDYLLEYK